MKHHPADRATPFSENKEHESYTSAEHHLSAVHYQPSLVFSPFINSELDLSNWLTKPREL